MVNTFEYKFPTDTQFQGIRVEQQEGLRLSVIGVASPEVPESRIDGNVATHLDDNGILHVAAGDAPNKEWVKLEASRHSRYNHCRILLGSALQHLTAITLLNCVDTSLNLENVGVDTLHIDRAADVENKAGSHTPPHLINLQDVDAGNFAAHLDGGSFAANRLQVSDSFTFVGHDLNNVALKSITFNDQVVTRVNLGAACPPDCRDNAIAR